MEKKTVFEKEWRALGTDIYVQIVGNGLQSDRMEKVFLEIKNLYTQQEKIFSRFDEQSELSQINARLGEFVEASADMLKVAEKSLEYFQESAGLFDPRILHTLEKIGYIKSFKENSFSGEVGHLETGQKGTLAHDLVIDGSMLKFMQRMDFSGIAKGYITDRVADFLRKKDCRDFLVDSGGDMFAQGKNNLGEKWGIALEGSKEEEEIVLEISDEAIATSENVRRNWKRGDKRFHHLINPYNTNDFSFVTQSVTVVAGIVERADVLAKVLFLSGMESGMELANRKKIKAIFLTQSGETIRSKY